MGRTRIVEFMCMEKIGLVESERIRTWGSMWLMKKALCSKTESYKIRRPNSGQGAEKTVREKKNTQGIVGLKKLT